MNCLKPLPVVILCMLVISFEITQTSTQLVDDIREVNITRSDNLNSGDRVSLRIVNSSQCQDQNAVNTGLSAQCTLLSLDSGEDVCFMECVCNNVTGSFILNRRKCGDERSLKQGCSFVFGSWSWSSGWVWNAENDRLSALYLEDGFGLQGGFNGSTAEFSECRYTSLSTYDATGVWNEFTAPENESAITFFQLRGYWHVYWIIEDLSKSKKAEIEGKFMKLDVTCENSNEVNGIVEFTQISSCLVFKVTGNISHEYNLTQTSTAMYPSTTVMPVTTTNIPISTDMYPSTTVMPVTTTNIPISTDMYPSTTVKPVTTINIPISTDMYPSTTVKPVTTTNIPISTDIYPSTTVMPLTTSSIPISTAMNPSTIVIPVTTTDIPIQSTSEHIHPSVNTRELTSSIAIPYVTPTPSHVPESSPVIESSPIIESISVMKSSSVIESSPAITSISVMKSSSVIESSPAITSISVMKSSSVIESSPAITSISVMKSSSVTQDNPVSKSSSIITPTAQATQSIINKLTTTVQPSKDDQIGLILGIVVAASAAVVITIAAIVLTVMSLHNNHVKHTLIIQQDSKNIRMRSFDRPIDV